MFAPRSSLHRLAVRLGDERWAGNDITKEIVKVKAEMTAKAVPQRHPRALRVLHWLIAALIIAALLFGTFIMARLPNSDPGKPFALLKHMLAGTAILGLSIARMVVRAKSPRLAPMSSGMVWADRIVPVVHRVFDALVLLMVGSGVVMALASGLPETVFLGRGVLPERLDPVALHALHVFVARLLAAFLALHVAGAFYHQFVLRDGLISRMSLRLTRQFDGAAS
jgi:cytochrome b561